jgi:hypothetical protein
MQLVSHAGTALQRAAFKFILAAVLLFPALVVAMDFRYENRNPANGAPYKNPQLRTLLLSGAFAQGDSQRFIEFVAQDPERYLRTSNVLITSSGGDLAEAISIAEILKHTYKVVTVSDWFGPCLSACFYVLAAAVKRDISDGAIGLHRPFLVSTVVDNAPLVELEGVQQRAYQSARTQLQIYGVSSRLIETMISRASNEIYWLTRFDKRELGRRAPWFEQVLVSRCNLNKGLEEKYFTEINPGLDDALESYVNGLLDCEARVIGNNPDRYLGELFSKMPRNR